MIEVQQAPRAASYHDFGAGDGVIGPRTLAAITRFRQEHGLPAGAIGNWLRTALELAKA